MKYIVYRKQKAINSDIQVHIYVGERLNYISGSSHMDTIKLFDTIAEAEKRIGDIDENDGYKVVNVETYIQPESVVFFTVAGITNIVKAVEDIRQLL